MQRVIVTPRPRSLRPHLNVALDAQVALGNCVGGVTAGPGWWRRETTSCRVAAR
jgi:hypothetical protein